MWSFFLFSDCHDRLQMDVEYFGFVVISSQAMGNIWRTEDAGYLSAQFS